MNLEALDPDRVTAALLDNGALSVTFTDAGDEPVLEPAPGETPLWTDTAVTALFDGGTDLSALSKSLQASLAVEDLPLNRIDELADRAWEREWLKDFGPMQFGERLWVMPGDDQEPAEDAIVVRLDPGLAFGTGTHATTALCLEWLEGLDLAANTVCDFGCGSGILGIAALKLGAREVDAVDTDLQAVRATRQNAERNLVEDRLHTGTELRSPSRQFDIVVANILAGTLIEHVALICNRLKQGGAIALSGILEDQVDEVCSAYQSRINLDTPVIKDGWALLSGTRS